MLYPEILNQVHELFPEGYYILPSSIDDLIIVPKSACIPPRLLGEMVRDINREQLMREQVLSDHIYEYDKENGDAKGRELTAWPQHLSGASRAGLERLSSMWRIRRKRQTLRRGYGRDKTVGVCYRRRRRTEFIRCHRLCGSGRKDPLQGQGKISSSEWDRCGG